MWVTLIAALDEDGAIGRSTGGLPWHLPAEIAHFRSYCRGKWVLAGRRTFEEMRGWFEHRARESRDDPAVGPPPVPLLLTRQPWESAGSAGASLRPRSVASVAEAIAFARDAGREELVVAGGAAAFAAALPHAGRLVLSRIHRHSGGDVFFPRVEWSAWEEGRRDPRVIDAASGTAFTVSWWQRRGGGLRPTAEGVTRRKAGGDSMPPSTAAPK